MSKIQIYYITPNLVILKGLSCFSELWKLLAQFLSFPPVSEYLTDDFLKIRVSETIYLHFLHFPATIPCFYLQVFYFDIIQHSMVVGIFTNDAKYMIFSFIATQPGSLTLFILRRQKDTLWFFKFSFGYEKFFGWFLLLPLSQ